MFQLLIDGAAREPNKTALRWIDRDQALTYAQSVEAMEHFAGAIHHLGVRPGDRVTIFAHNGMDYPIGLLGCLGAGPIAALVNVRFAHNLEWYPKEHKRSLIIHTPAVQALARLA